MMDYERSISSTMDINAIEAARALLTNHGFHVHLESNGFVAVGPLLRSTKEDPLRGAGILRVNQVGEMIVIRADLAGTRMLVMLILLLPLGLALTSVIAFGSQAIMHLVPWVFISPAMAWWVRHRTRNALDMFACALQVG